MNVVATPLTAVGPAVAVGLAPTGNSEFIKVVIAALIFAQVIL